MLQEITIEQAQALLCDNISKRYMKEAALSTELVPVDDALGRILAEDAAALYDQPPFPRSPLDGYAFRGEDTAGATPENPVRLKVVGKIYAGYAFAGEIGPGEALRLMTGSPIPKGANAVIRQEDTDFEQRAMAVQSSGKEAEGFMNENGGKADEPFVTRKRGGEEAEDLNIPNKGQDEVVLVYKECKPYSNYCYQGEDYHAGEILLEKGHRINSGAIAVLSSLGMTEVRVYKKPQIAVFSSGDEVVEPGQPLASGKIYDSNRHYVMARLKELGVPAAICQHVMDQPEDMAEKIRQASRTCPLIVTLGGVSVGEKDIMHDVARLLDAEVLFWRVRVKPGSPTLAFTYKDTLVICLSGNPFGAIANLELLVRPVLAELAHDRSLALKKQKATIIKGYAKPSGMRRYLRGHLHGDEVSLSDRKQVSGAVASMADCNCFVEIPPEMKGAQEGEEVWVYCL